MSVSNINQLILDIPRVEAQEARRSAKKKTQTVASLQVRGAKIAGPLREHGSIKKIKTNASGSAEAAEQHEDTEMAEDDDADLVNAESGFGEAEDECSSGIETLAGIETGNESDNTLAEFEDESAVSPTGAKTKRTHDKVCLTPCISSSTADSSTDFSEPGSSMA